MRRMAISAVLLTLAAMPAMAQSKAAIQKASDQWSAAFNKGDAAAVAAMYTDDAYVLPAGAPMAHGHDAIQAFWTDAMQHLGDVKSCTFKTKGDASTAGALKYAVVWQKADTQWKLLQDIWNFDK